LALVVIGTLCPIPLNRLILRAYFRGYPKTPLSIARAYIAQPLYALRVVSPVTALWHRVVSLGSSYYPLDTQCCTLLVDMRDRAPTLKEAKPTHLMIHDFSFRLSAIKGNICHGVQISLQVPGLSRARISLQGLGLSRARISLQVSGLSRARISLQDPGLSLPIGCSCREPFQICHTTIVIGQAIDSAINLWAWRRPGSGLTQGRIL
jgi:hypothetical protein